MSNLQDLEIEFKYRADTLSSKDFVAYCKKKGGKPFFVSGMDYFYSSVFDNNAFIRHRIGDDMNQLTYKRKLDAENNVVRVERNIDLSESTGVDTIEGLCRDLNFRYNTKIVKRSFVCHFKDHTLSYYVCLDVGGNKLGAFVEVELPEGKNWKSKEAALQVLEKIERRHKSLQVYPHRRLEKSLYEMFRKDLSNVLCY